MFVLSVLIAPMAHAGDTLSYDRFLTTVLEKNLDLKIESAKSSAAESNAGGLNIPPPMVGYVKMRDQSGGSASGFEVSQMIPFPTKISNGRSARKLERDAQAESLLAVESETRANAKIVYFNLWASQQRLDALREKKSVIESHIRLSRAGVRSDSFLRIHLLKAESDLDLLENEILAATQEVVEKQAVAATFFDVDAANFHPTLEEPPLGQIPAQAAVSSPHQLEFAKLQAESMKAKESEARSTWFPDLYLRYKEIGQTQLTPETSELMVGLTLPFIFPWDSSANVGKASGDRLRSELEYEQARRRIDNEKSVLFNKAASLKKQLDNITQKLLPRAEKRMKVVHNVAPRDAETLQDHRETLEAFPDLKLKALDIRAQYETVISELTKFERGAK